MWNGAAPNLKAMPATMNTRPVSSRPGEACDIAAWMPCRSSVPVAPYISDRPYTSNNAEIRHVNIFSTSAATSRTNIPLRAMPSPPTPSAIIAPANSSAAIESAWVTQRCRSSRNRSSISSANAAPTSTSSGNSGSSSVAEGMVGVMLGFSELARSQLAGELGDGGFHQVGQRLRIHAEREHADGERAEHDPFPHVDVFEFGDVRIADLAEDGALDQPQRVRRAE